MDLSFIRGDLSNPAHQKALFTLVDSFCRESSGTEKHSGEERQKALIEGLASLATTRIFFALMESQFCGIAVCFLGFSSFKVQSLINIHDFYIAPGFRAKGIGTQFLTFIADEAQKMGCCKVTLEVNESNPRAKALYERMGYAGSRQDEPEKLKYFLEKEL